MHISATRSTFLFILFLGYLLVWVYLFSLLSFPFFSEFCIFSNIFFLFFSYSLKVSCRLSMTVLLSSITFQLLYIFFFLHSDFFGSVWSVAFLSSRRGFHPPFIHVLCSLTGFLQPFVHLPFCTLTQTIRDLPKIFVLFTLTRA